YLHRKLFLKDGSCTLTDTGALLALRRKEGTLRWLAQKWPKLVFAGKTGSSPHDDSAVAAVGICLDQRPVVLVGALRPLLGALPLGLRGSVVLRGLDSYLKALVRLDRRPASALWPAWVEEELAGRRGTAEQGAGGRAVRRQRGADALRRRHEPRSRARQGGGGPSRAFRRRVPRASDLGESVRAGGRGERRCAASVSLSRRASCGRSRSWQGRFSPLRCSRDCLGFPAPACRSRSLSPGRCSGRRSGASGWCGSPDRSRCA